MEHVDLLPFGDPFISSERSTCPPFVDLSGHITESEISIPPEHVRVLIGQPGTGKTRCLLAHPLFEVAQASGVVDIGNHLDTHGIEDVRRASTLGGAGVVEYWESWWQVATLRAVASHLLYSKHWKDRASEETRGDLRALVAHFADAGVPIDVTTSLRQLCVRQITRNEFKKFLSSETLERGRKAIYETLEEERPFVVAIDVNDELLDNSPMAWCECLQGLLFYSLNSESGPESGRLAVVATVPARVYRAAASTPRGSRLHSRTQIHRITWRPEDAAAFLSAKVIALDDRLLLRPDISPDLPVQRWLGRKTVRNSVRCITEQLDLYLLRHTRRTPRHIIALGNALSDAAVNAKASGKSRIPLSQLIAVVHSIAGHFAREMLMQCSSDLVIAGVGKKVSRGRAARYLGVNEDVESLNSLLASMIRQLPSEIVSMEDVRSRVASLSGLADTEADEVLSAMLRHHVFAMVSRAARGKEKLIFLSAFDEEKRFAVQDQALKLHSIVRDLMGTTIGAK